MKYTHKDYKLGLWKSFMESTNLVPETYRDIMGKIAAVYVDNTSFLFRIYEAFRGNERFLEDEKNCVKYERDGEEYILSFNGKECIFDKETFRRIIASYLDLLEDTLPLGTVVDLRKDVFENVEDLKNLEAIRFVITHRFLGDEKDMYYFPYGGVVYPTGMLGRKEVYYFTRPLVEKIVHMGFRDEQEEAFVYIMKHDLVVQKGKNTYGYATDEDVRAFSEKVRDKVGRREV